MSVLTPRRESPPRMSPQLSSHTVRNRVLRLLKRFRQANLPRLTCSVRTWTLSLVVVLLLLWSLGWPLLGGQTRQTPKHEAVLSSNTQSNNLNNESQIDEPASSQLDSKSLGMIFNESDRLKKEEGYKWHAFNILISERIGLRRPLPDTRNELCRYRAYDVDRLSKLNTSVIICFYNEDFHTLQRTIYSVLEGSPASLLKEIILVDDHSDNGIGDKLGGHKRARENTNSDYARKVHYYRTPERAGLIRARLYGTHFAQGQVIFFLDSHCEMNRHWLEPLLERIAENRKTVACPIIDLIDPDTFAYSPSPIVKGGFNWGLHFKWDSVPTEQLSTKDDFIKPIKSPTMAGGLFAIEREYFNELGTYDRGMDIWGGENIEISFRIWMCGGQLEIVPCSRVGHVFRHRRPYGSPEGVDTLAYNSLRAAHVWMDDYKKHFLASRSDLATMNYGNVAERIELRHTLNCSSFEWYLRNVYPEMLTPEQEKQKKAQEENLKKVNVFDRKPQKVIRKFAIQLADTKLCVESESEITYKGVKLYLAECSRQERKQHWKETAIHDIRLGPKSCIEALHGKANLRLAKCHEMGGTQQWELHQTGNATQLYNSGSGLCLAIKSNEPLDAVLQSKSYDNLHLSMTFCTSEVENHETRSWTRWILIPI